MPTRAYHLLCLLLASLAADRPAEAEDLLRGRVTDASGAIIRDASIQFLIDGNAAIETKTGIKGDFTLALPTGVGSGTQYTIRAVATGFAPTTLPLRVEDSGPMVLTLEVAPYRQSLEIHASMPANESLLDMSGVRESSAKDLGEALTALDGVWKIRKAGIANDLVIRGFQQNNINVLVDGSRI